MHVRDLSIAIPSWNTCDLLDQCLASVFANSGGVDFEIIVVDNASTDGSPAMVETRYPGVRLVRNRINLGFAAACNIAFKYSTGRYFLLLNSDTVVLENTLKGMVDFMDAHPRAGAAGCRLLNFDRSLQRSCSRFPGIMTELYDALYLSKLFPRSRLFGSFAMSWWDFDDTREVDFAGGSCLILRRAAIEEVGLLDEGFFMYCEEADWCYRLWDRGWKVYYYPGVEIIHFGGQSARRYGNDIFLHLYISRNRFIRKHRGRLTAGIHRAVIALGASLRIVAFSFARLASRKHNDAFVFHAKLLAWTIFPALVTRKLFSRGDEP